MIPGLMGDKGEGGGGFVVPNLFLVFLMSLGIVASEKPVRSHRPADNQNLQEQLAMEMGAAAKGEFLPNEGVPNHLWEDPLELVETSGKAAPRIKDVYQNWIEEREKIIPNGTASKDLCLIVGLPSGKSSSAVEKRIRIRSAVSSALLAEEKFYYYHGASLQIAEWKYPVETVGGKKNESSVSLAYSRLYHPYFQNWNVGESKEWNSNYRSVFLLYVDEGAWGGDFGERILQLFEELRFQMPEPAAGVEREQGVSENGKPEAEKPAREDGKEDWVYVGLTNSHRLHELVKESYEKQEAGKLKPGEVKLTLPALEESGYQEKVRRERWERFRVITPHATIDEDIFTSMFWNSEAKRVFQKEKSGEETQAGESAGNAAAQHQSNQGAGEATPLFARSNDQYRSPVSEADKPDSTLSKTGKPSPKNLKIERLMTHDGILSEALIEELEQRQIRPGQRNEEGRKEAVLLLSEMDSFYGRSIAMTFGIKWKERYPDDRDKLVSLHYQLGLDGHEREPASGPGGAGENEPVKLELAEGRSQIDSVTRLVGRIKTIERMRGIQFKAIGVLGSDVYDKLLLLRALRPEFHEARFFTTDLDARLWQGPERKAARNLIVASSPLFNVKNQVELKVPPFRSDYQLGTYQAIRAALADPQVDQKTKGGDDHCRPPNELGMYEIGKNGPIFLGGYRKEGGVMEPIMPSHPALEYPVEGFSSSHFALLMTMILLVFLYCSWPHLTPLWRREVFDGKIKREWNVRDRVLGGVYLVTAVYLASLVVRLQKGCPHSIEPVRLMDGVSVWPTVIFNVLISMLAVCWLVRSWKILDWSHNNLRDCFPFNSGLKVSQGLGEAVGRFDRGGTLKRRLMRTGFLFVAYILVYWFLLRQLPSQNIENLARGEMAAVALENTDMISHVFMALLLFFICDAVFHFSRAIHFGKIMVTNGRFDQVYPGSEEQEREGGDDGRRIWNKPGMSEDEIRAISAALENGHSQPYWQTSMLELAVRRSQTIGSLLYYPFICLFFLFIARNAVFDDFALSERLIWTYLLMFSLLAGAIIYSQFALKRLFLESGVAIRAAMQSNPEPVAKYYQEELEVLHEMQEKATYGIFSNPLFKAAIIPIGGSGILEMVSQIAPVLRGG